MKIDELLLNRVQHDYSDAGFVDLYLKLDLLHDLASTGRLAEATSLSIDEVRGWLEEYIFIARETIRELSGGL